MGKIKLDRSTRTTTAYQENRSVVGLIPAAGRARRLGRLPVSKEILPVEVRRTPRGVISKVACEYLLDRFRLGGVEDAVLVTRRGKEDIPRYLGSGAGQGVSLAYVLVEDSTSVPETLDAAYPFVRGRTVALGFPDLLWTPEDAYGRLLEAHGSGRADVTLGLFPVEAARRSTTDMVRVDAENRVREIEVRPRSSELRCNWLLAIWEPSFTDWLHRRMGYGRETGAASPTEELRLGALLNESLADGLTAMGVAFSNGTYVDLGTPEGLERARRLRSGSLE